MKKNILILCILLLASSCGKRKLAFKYHCDDVQIEKSIESKIKSEIKSYNLHLVLIDTLNYLIEVNGQDGIHGTRVYIKLSDSNQCIILLSNHRSKYSNQLLEQFLTNLTNIYSDKEISELRSKINYYYVRDYANIPEF